MSVLDMTGQPCPLPVIEAKRALKSAGPGQTVLVLVDNDIARQNLQKMAAGLGHEFSYESRSDGRILAAIKTSAGGRVAEAGRAGLVVALGREGLGEGSEELGRALMKSFIYSLTELENPPEQLLFFNAGVCLTTEDSGTLEALNSLAARGTAIRSCEACLDYYGLSGRLRVGTLTDMSAIANSLAQAGRLINL